MNIPEEFSNLWTDYLEGDLDESGIARLRDLLSSDEHLLKLAAELYQTHRLLGLVSENTDSRQDQFVQEVLSRLPDSSDHFIHSVMARVEQSTHTEKRLTSPNRAWISWQSMLLATVLTLVAIVGSAFWPEKNPGRHHQQVNNNPPGANSSEQGGVRFISLARARFFGELLPPDNSQLSLNRDYVLMSGLAEVRFPAGATAIVEGPAVFRVLSDECLALDVGRCSVHAPDGAEGFRVETPVTRVVDRGTRFTVSVAETSETEVQVIEGAADVYEMKKRSEASQDEVRLTDGEARRFIRGRVFSTDDIPFDQSTYRQQLPDRIVSYKATTAEDGGAENLISVTVQREGRITEIPVENLIPARVIAFKATSPGAYLCGNETLPQVRAETSSDHSLITGVINPGGSEEPLTTTPVLSGEDSTPGLAIRFDQSVLNGPGPDVVFFDLQTLSNPPEGDAFHVSPLQFREGLRSHTIRVFDLTMESPHARDLTNFYVYMFDDVANSLAMLESVENIPNRQAIRFRGLAVGIDLSDLGYAEGESVEGLFFQDALDDKHHVDPVLIGGLPVME
ncbi:MAG: FecR domain-containing protein [Planctomycetaceae bacterium]|nr:FecR domain-containing protein [Planctomycetaceae bacterium]